jgi:hypothetical protein
MSFHKLFLSGFHGEGAMKIIGAALLFLCLASGGMAVSTTLASAHAVAAAKH